jgi:rhamnulokinase
MDGSEAGAGLDATYSNSPYDSRMPVHPSRERVAEYTNATTTQLIDFETGGWSRDLLEGLDLPPRLFAPIVAPGTELGVLLPEVVQEVGAGPPVFAVASHDTASAVVAVPALGEDFAYVSSGTWSLVGVETQEPVVTPEAMEANFTNEGGFGGGRASSRT